MAASRVEELTIGELSNRVAATNAREDSAADARHVKLVKETTDRIMTIIGSEIYRSPLHPWRPHRNGCASCFYPEDHPVHREPKSS